MFITQNVALLFLLFFLCVYTIQWKGFTYNKYYYAYIILRGIYAFRLIWYLLLSSISLLYMPKYLLINSCFGVFSAFFFLKAKHQNRIHKKFRSHYRWYFEMVTVYTIRVLFILLEFHIKIWFYFLLYGPYLPIHHPWKYYPLSLILIKILPQYCISLYTFHQYIQQYSTSYFINLITYFGSLIHPFHFISYFCPYGILLIKLISLFGNSAVFSFIFKAAQRKSDSKKYHTISFIGLPIVPIYTPIYGMVCTLLSIAIYDAWCDTKINKIQYGICGCAIRICNKNIWS